jgi:hypothetical protein
MSKFGLGLAQVARLGRRQLIAFAILSAIVNGLVTAAVGALLAQSYATYQSKRQAVQTIANLVYERRTRAGMVVWSIKRNAELDEIRYRKRAYDEAFVEWNKKIQLNIFMIRDISSEVGVTRLETQFQELLVPALSATDQCVTKAYDERIKGGDGTALFQTCQMADLHQFTLDCGATFTNELDRLSRYTVLPFTGPTLAQRKQAEARIDKGCAAMPKPVIASPPPMLPLPGPAAGGVAPALPTVAQKPTLDTEPMMIVPASELAPAAPPN